MAAEPMKLSNSIGFILSNSAGTAEIGNAQLGGNPCAGEHDRPPRALEQRQKIVDLRGGNHGYETGDNNQTSPESTIRAAQPLTVASTGLLGNGAAGFLRRS